MNVLVVNARDCKSVVNEFKKHKIALMTGVNTLYNAMLHEKSFATLDFSSLRVAVGGSVARRSVGRLHGDPNPRTRGAGIRIEIIAVVGRAVRHHVRTILPRRRVAPGGLGFH